jgi:SpoVK/Ycf46/Vps4 family AAA+-type ATPase
MFKAAENFQTNQDQPSRENFSGVGDVADLVESSETSKGFQFDLGEVESKYIGETEKNLNQVFEKGETVSTSLLFDEADALFEDRTSSDSGEEDKH